MIDWVTTPFADMPRKDNLIPTGTYALAKNIKKVKTSGIEFDLIYKNSFSNKQQLFIDAGATFLHSVTGDTNPSFYILSHAKTLIQSNIIYSYNKVNLATNFVYKYRDALSASGINTAITKDYLLINIKGGYSINKKTECFIACNNLTDVKYSDLLGSLMPGRWLSGGINISF